LQRCTKVLDDKNEVQSWKRGLVMYVEHRRAALLIGKRIFATLTSAVVFFSVVVVAQVTFSKATYPLQTAPSEVVTADLNGDGLPDLVVFSAATGNISVLLNTGDGTFALAINLQAGTNPLGAFTNTYPTVAVADLNGDNRPDILVSNPANPGSTAGPSVKILLGNGDGTFQPPTTFDLDFNYPVLVGVGDFNGDRKTDVVLFGTDAANSLVMLVGNGDGTFSRSDFLLPSSHSPISHVTDFNEDGKLDVIYALNNSFMDVFLGNGDATFQSPHEVGMDAFGPFFLTSADFNHDGKTDLVWTSYQWRQCEFGVCHDHGPAGSVEVMLGNGNGTFNGGPGALDTGDFGFAAVADFDGDGNLDLAANGTLPSPSLQTKIYLGDGRGGFSSAISESLSALATPDLKAADFNGDGLADLVVTDSNAVVVGMNTTSTFHFSFSPAELPAVHSGGSASLTVNIKALNGFGNAVTLACSAPASLGINCSFSSTSLMPGGSATLTVTTAASSTAMNRSRSMMRFLYALGLPILGVVFALMTLEAPHRGGRKRLAILPFFLFAGVFLQAACGGSNGTVSQHGTPPGAYTITVMGTSGSIQHSTTTTLTVK
jgi:hypothetical protein